MEAMDLAARRRLPVLSCAPLAEGAKIAALACAGFRADHECYSAEETLAKLRNGMYAMIRESSVAHFLTENLRVITEHRAKADRIAFCTDDVTATDVLSRGHLDHLVRMAIAQGLEPMRAIQMATINCAQIYRIDHVVGSISPGRVADILNPADMAAAVNHLAAEGGGQVVVRDGEVLAFLALPIGGIVADLHPREMARMEAGLDDAARGLGCRLPSPFMYLIFLSITAIPDYAITDLGLIDCVSLQAISPLL